MSVTLEEIKATQAKLAEMIAAIESTNSKLLIVREAQIELRHGERYAGLVLGDQGNPSYHLVLLPGEAEDVSWSDAKEWADQAGGALPTRQEQALLYANLKSEFKSEWYWSSQEYTVNGSSAWDQDFSSGYQSISIKSVEGRARAVRRFPI